MPRRKAGITRKAVWKPRAPGEVRDFHLTYSFRCQLPIPQPRPGMVRLTDTLDAPPKGPARSGKSEGMEVLREAARLIKQGMSDPDKVHAFYEFVNGMEDREISDNQSAWECLRDGGGDSGGKARLLVALCRAAGIHARFLSGLVLEKDNPAQPLHHWVEAWVGGGWLTLDPTRHIFDKDAPENYLVLQLGERKIVSSAGATLALTCQVERLPGAAGGVAGSPARRFWQRLSLHGLRPAEQHLVRFLLRLALAAVIVSFFRTVIGVPTFGTFSPALLGLAFIDLESLAWGIPVFLLLVLTGWGMRHLLERFHLLQVPRASALLTLIVSLLILIIIITSNYGIAATQYFSLLPLVILTHLVERFWTVEAEDGSASSFKTLLGTTVIAIVVSVVLSPDAVTAWMFRYPETLGVALAAQFVLGRYTGYRLAELYRFGDLLLVENAAGGARLATGEKPIAAPRRRKRRHDPSASADLPAQLVHALARLAPPRHPGHEPAQRRVYSRPEPAPAYPVVDSKRKMRDLCQRIGVPTPAIYGSVAAHSALRHLPQLLAGHDDFVIKPNRGAGGRGILVVAGREGDAFLRHNGERLTLSDLRQHVSSTVSGLFSLGGQSDEALIQQRVLPHPAFDALTYQGIPDVRVIVYKKAAGNGHAAVAHEGIGGTGQPAPGRPRRGHRPGKWPNDPGRLPQPRGRPPPRHRDEPDRLFGALLARHPRHGRQGGRRGRAGLPGGGHRPRPRPGAAAAGGERPPRPRHPDRQRPGVAPPPGSHRP